MANSNYANVTITTTATQILGASTKRKGLMVVNASNSNLYVGMDSSVTTSNGLLISPQASIEFGGKNEGWTGAIFGIVASGTADIRYWQWGE